VNEYVLSTVFRSDETEAFRCVEPLNCTSTQSNTLYKIKQLGENQLLPALIARKDDIQGPKLEPTKSTLKNVLTGLEPKRLCATAVKHRRFKYMDFYDELQPQ